MNCSQLIFETSSVTCAVATMGSVKAKPTAKMAVAHVFMGGLRLTRREPAEFH
jgi:hypothetical protein